MTVRSLVAPLLLVTAASLFSGCQGTPEESAAQTSSADNNVIQSVHHDFRIETFAEGFQHPWGMAFLPSGDVLVTERGRIGENEGPGALRIVRDGELLPDPVPGLPEIRVGGQGGLLDVVLHPEFESRRLVYLSYSKPGDDGAEGTTAVIRGRFENDQLQDVEEVFEAEAWTSGRGHYGSRIAFDGDGYMFVTIGDRQVNPSGTLEEQWNHPSQDLTNHFGTVIRLHDDGRVPEDNPFTGDEDALPEIWSYGHRNPQGLAIHHETGEIWSNEHGPQGGDELNLIRPGVNYGWPVIGYGVNYGEGTPLHHTVSAEGLERPVHHWLPSIAPGDMIIYRGDKFPEWRGSIFNAGLSGRFGELSRVTTEDGEFVSQERMLPGEYRIRGMEEGLDGYIYLATDNSNGELTPIVRLVPAR